MLSDFLYPVQIIHILFSSLLEPFSLVTAAFFAVQWCMISGPCGGNRQLICKRHSNRMYLYFLLRGGCK
ncbi:hypothetical protein BDZ91DRAFT_533216 [Kalaharituber pfeilii]|nr:hypothetical protein BDZ91DRAFT_533216 [Kalaharituber pfeilii]